MSLRNRRQPAVAAAGTRRPKGSRKRRGRSGRSQRSTGTTRQGEAEQGAEQRERHVPARIFGSPGGDRDVLETGAGEEPGQPSQAQSGPGRGAGGRRNGQAIWATKKRPTATNPSRGRSFAPLK